MPTDTSGEKDVGTGSGPRSLRPEEWVTTPQFVGGVVLVVLGVFVAGLGTPGSAGGPWDLTGNQVLLIGVVAVTLGVVVALSGYRLTARQQQYLDQVQREQLEIRDYLRFLDEIEPERTADEHEVPDATTTEDPVPGEEQADERFADSSAEADLPPLWELRQRLRLADRGLEEAKDAIYRRDYANYLSLYYPASREEILLYDLLDEHAIEWAFGLDSDETAGEDVTASPDPEPHRRRNLSERIRSFAEGLPESQQELVRRYLGGPDTLPTPWRLYYAVRVLHDWNVGQYKRALQIKRVLRAGIVTQIVVLVGLAVVLPLAFPEGLLEPFGDTMATANGTSGSVPGAGIVTNDVFLALVVLAGAFGAIFSMFLRSSEGSYRFTTDPTVSDPEYMLEAFVVRVLFGGVSALVLFFIARTELAAVVFTQSILDSPLALLLLGFVAGFSETLVQNSLKKVEGELAVSEESAGTETGTSAGPAAPGDLPPAGSLAGRTGGSQSTDEDIEGGTDGDETTRGDEG
jgi:hypothetical protein